MKRKLLIVFALSFAVCLLLCLAACDEVTGHEHTFAEEWTSDSDNHWHVATCEHTKIVSDLAAHTWDEGSTVAAATVSSPGKIKYTCTVCGKEKIVESQPINASNVSVHYDLNGGAWSADDTVIADYNALYINKSSIILTEQLPVLNDCVFAGWDVQIDLTSKEANVKAVWLDGMEGVTDEKGNPVNPKRLVVDEYGDPDFIPKKASTYIDANKNGRQDDDEPIEEYIFAGWQKTSKDGSTLITPVFRTRGLVIKIKFDFNGGFPSSVISGGNPYNLESTTQSGGYYYQWKRVVAIFNPNGSLTYRATIMDDDTKNCSANANPADTGAHQGIDQISIPVRANHEFIGWAMNSREAVNGIAIPSQLSGNQITGPSIYFNTISDYRFPTFYAIWKESGPTTMTTTVAFDFNEGYPSMVLGGSITTTLDTSASIWETDPPALNHYVQYKSVTGYSTSNTTFNFSVDDDPLANSIIDDISIPVRTGYTFIGWGLTHSYNPVMLSNAVLFVYHTDTATYTYTDANDSIDVGASIILYAQWRPNERLGKIIIQFIEDNIDFNTGDGTYHSDVLYAPQSAPALSNNPNPPTVMYDVNNPTTNFDGIFLESIYNYGASPVAEPSPDPVGGMYNGVSYVFAHWTYDAVYNPDLDAFDPNTVVDVPYIEISSPHVVALRYYAVYRPADVLFYHGRVDVSPTTIAETVKLPITEADYGKYLIVVYCCDYDDGVNHPNCGVSVKLLDDTNNPPTVTTLISIAPSDYLIYYQDTFQVTTGSAIYLEFYLPYPNLGGQWFTFDIYYLG